MTDDTRRALEHLRDVLLEPRPVGDGLTTIDLRNLAIANLTNVILDQQQQIDAMFLRIAEADRIIEVLAAERRKP